MRLHIAHDVRLTSLACCCLFFLARRLTCATPRSTLGAQNGRLTYHRRAAQRQHSASQLLLHSPTTRRGAEPFHDRRCSINVQAQLVEGDQIDFEALGRAFAERPPSTRPQPTCCRAGRGVRAAPFSAVAHNLVQFKPTAPASAKKFCCVKRANNFGCASFFSWPPAGHASLSCRA